MTNLQKERVILLRAQGESYARIADALSLSINTIQSYCRRNNLPCCLSDKPLPMADDLCVNCGSALTHTAGSRRKRFCSDKCRLKWWATHPEAMNRKAIYHFVCPICGKAFEAYGNAHRKYCSRSCLGIARKVSV